MLSYNFGVALADISTVQQETCNWFNAYFSRQLDASTANSSAIKLLDDLRPTLGLLLRKFLPSCEFKYVCRNGFIFPNAWKR